MATQSATEDADQPATDGTDQSTTDSDGIGIGVDEEGVDVVVAAGACESIGNKIVLTRSVPHIIGKLRNIGELLLLSC